MRELGFVTVAAVTVSLAAAGPAAASHAGGGGGRDFAVGSAKNMQAEVSPYPAELRVSAHAFDDELPTLGGLFGSDRVTGHVVGSGALPIGPFHVQGEVTCLKVVGNQATIKYRFKTTSGAGAPPEGWGVQVFVMDGGSGVLPDGNGTDLPLPAEDFEPFADQCERPRGPYNPIDSGNYVVHDADPPLP